MNGSLLKVPTYRDLMLPVLQAVDRCGGSASASEINKGVVEALALSEDVLARTNKNGRGQFEANISWARSYCKKSGLLEGPKSRLYRMTAAGREILELGVDEAQKRLADLVRVVRRASRDGSARAREQVSEGVVGGSETPSSGGDSGDGDFEGAGPKALLVEVPTYRDLMLPVLQAVDRCGGSASAREIRNVVVEALALSEEVLVRTNKNGRGQFEANISWARSYCKKSGLLKGPESRLYRMTPAGREILALGDDEAQKRLADLVRDVKRTSGGSARARERASKGAVDGSEVPSGGRDSDDGGFEDEGAKASVVEVPTYKDLMLPVLRAVDRCGGSALIHEIKTSVVEALAPSEEVLARTNKNGNGQLFANMGWACTYCKLAGLLESPKRGQYSVTPLGYEILALDVDEARKRLIGIDRDVRRARRDGSARAREKAGEDASIDSEMPSDGDEQEELVEDLWSSAGNYL